MSWFPKLKGGGRRLGSLFFREFVVAEKMVQEYDDLALGIVGVNVNSRSFCCLSRRRKIHTSIPIDELPLTSQHTTLSMAIEEANARRLQDDGRTVFRICGRRRWGAYAQ